MFTSVTDALRGIADHVIIAVNVASVWWKGRSAKMFVVQWQTYFRPAKTLGGVPDTPLISRDEMSRQHPVHSVQIQNTVSSFLAVLTG